MTPRSRSLGLLQPKQKALGRPDTGPIRNERISPMSVQARPNEVGKTWMGSRQFDPNYCQPPHKDKARNGSCPNNV